MVSTILPTVLSIHGWFATMKQLVDAKLLISAAGVLKLPLAVELPRGSRLHTEI